MSFWDWATNSDNSPPAPQPYDFLTERMKLDHRSFPPPPAPVGEQLTKPGYWTPDIMFGRSTANHALWKRGFESGMQTAGTSAPLFDAEANSTANAIILAGLAVGGVLLLTAVLR